jgi:hypothetical protein
MLAWYSCIAHTIHPSYLVTEKCRVKVLRTNPETDEIPGAPLTTLGFNRLQVVIGEHQLSVCQTRLALDSKLVNEASHFRPLDLLHDDIDTGVLIFTMVRAGEVVRILSCTGKMVAMTSVG